LDGVDGDRKGMLMGRRSVMLTVLGRGALEPPAARSSPPPPPPPRMSLRMGI
jgi:hypothetical protein